MTNEYKFSGKAWKYSAKDPWYFVTLPINLAAEMKLFSEPLKKGFGSIRVDVKLGSSKWRTSIFPDKNSGSYILPLKKEVRITNNIEDGSNVTIKITPEINH